MNGDVVADVCGVVLLVGVALAVNLEWESVVWPVGDAAEDDDVAA